MAGFCNLADGLRATGLRYAKPTPRKSLVTTPNIPVCERLALETGFDCHCLAQAALAVGSFSAPNSMRLGILFMDCCLIPLLRTKCRLNDKGTHREYCSRA
jgi:hypothetical protein